MWNILVGIYSKMEAEEWNSDLEDREMQSNHSEQKTEKIFWQSENLGNSVTPLNVKAFIF